MHNANLAAIIRGDDKRQPKESDPWFGRGEVATAIRKQAAINQMLGIQDIQQAERRIELLFTIPGTPADRDTTTPLHEDLKLLINEHMFNGRDAHRYELSPSWTITKDRSMFLNPRSKYLANFDRIDLITGQIWYSHALENVVDSFHYFLTLEDHKAFVQLINETRNKTLQKGNSL